MAGPRAGEHRHALTAIAGTAFVPAAFNRRTMREAAMDERDIEERREPVRHETTIINTGGDRGRGGFTLFAFAIALIAGVLCFLYFGGYFGRGADRDVNINLTLPDININPGNSAK